MALDNPNVTTKTELFTSQRSEQVKQHIVYDASDRPVLAFTAAVDAQDGDPCSVTEYVYRSLTSTQIVARQERVYAWDSDWDTAFTFDPTASYDPDGDGVL